MARGLVAAEFGLGALTAAQVFAMLSGTVPVPVSTGRTDRHHLNRLGDRQLNRALHVTAVSQMRSHPAALALAERRQAEHKTDRRIRRRVAPGGTAC